jgi:peptidoglycan/LPS O-acetylase OafA/YrhL
VTSPIASFGAIAPLPSLSPFAETPVPDLDPSVVTPGIEGFLVFFVLALAAWLLYRSLLKQIRRVDVRAAQRREEEARAAISVPSAADVTARDAGAADDDAADPR